MKPRIAVAAAALLLGAAVLFAQTDVIVLDYGSSMFQPVPFKHKMHADEMKVGCTKCHHKAENAKCGVCHPVENGDGRIKAKDAFHGLCKECHLERKREGKNPPTACTGCHPRK